MLTFSLCGFDVTIYAVPASYQASTILLVFLTSDGEDKVDELKNVVDKGLEDLCKTNPEIGSDAFSASFGITSLTLYDLSEEDLLSVRRFI